MFWGFLEPDGHESAIRYPEKRVPVAEIPENINKNHK